MSIKEEPKLIWTKVRKFPRKTKSFRWLYEGQVLNNTFHGFGILTKIYKDEECKKFYAGDWINSKRSGSGQCWYDNGDYYEGNFLNNKRHGFGRMWYRDGSFYQGLWENDLHNGTGLLVQSNGNRYEGQFEFDQKHGDGIFYHVKTGQIQKGYWVNNQCKSSIIQDTHWRQVTSYSTPYPIPKLDPTINDNQ
ncbi:MORN repeat-containing protein 3-like [Chelonus insularis]|uniref:MORN repeat-containing protein 3-like n=1 Tax=Chelonus insularis TaxID=460826 RepID=UPI00158999F3|nr:MORN repeat-containing protein 3-like [Chelonus insularis]